MKPYKWMSICVTLALLTGLLAGCAPSATPTALTPAPIKTEEAYPLEAASPESPAATAAAGEVPAELYPPEEPDRVVRLTDALGRAVELPGLPMNIVVVGKATSLLNNALFLFPEASERVKAYEQRIQTEHDFITDVFDPTGAKASLARDANAEQVAPLNPDLVIMKTYMRDSIGQGMEAIGIPVVYLDMETPESLYTDLRTIGAIFGNPERAEALVSLYQANTQRVADAIKDVPEYAYPTTVVLQYSSKGGEISFKVPPASYLQTTLVEMAGGIPVWKESQNFGGWAVITLEQIAVWDPQVIFLIDYSGNATEVVEGLKQDPTWQNLKAVQSNLLLPFPSDFLSWDQADARWGLGLLWMASKLQPGQFEGINFVDEVKAFYRDYYGLGDAVITEKVLPLVKGL